MVSLSVFLSACLSGQEDKIEAKSSATGNLQLVSYDASTANLLATGQLHINGVLSSSVVQFHLSASCDDPVLAQGTEGQLETTGIPFSVAAGKAAKVYVSATGFTPCVVFGGYTPNTSNPEPPSFTSSSPASPSRVSHQPRIFGSTTGFSFKVLLFDDSSCSNLVGIGTTKEFSTIGIEAGLQANKHNTVYAQAMEPFGRLSTCALLTTYVHSNTGPAAPLFAAISPPSPNNTTTAIRVIGTIASDVASVTLFSDPSCSTVVASGAGSTFSSTGIAGTVAANASTKIYAIAYDTSGAPSACAYMTSYLHDNIPPDPPSATGVAAVPASPTNASTFPKLSGTPSTDAVAVKFFNSSNCSTSIGSGTADDFKSGGIAVGVAANATTSIYAQDFDIAANASTCIKLMDYVHNTIPPDPPVFNTTVPASPNNSSTTPYVVGSASLTTVLLKLYTDENCTNFVTSGTPAAYMTTGIPVAVAPNAATEIFATAIDIEGNASACTELTTYEHSNLPADPPVYWSAYPPSPTNTSFTPNVLGTASAGSSIKFFNGAGCSSQIGTGPAILFKNGGIQVTVPKNVVTHIYGIVHDKYGNDSACAYLTDYIYNEIPPFDPTYVALTPYSPINASATTTTPKILGYTTYDPLNVLPVTRVGLFDNAACSNMIGSGTPAEFVSPGIMATVIGNATTTIYAQAFDDANNYSNCVLMTQFTNDTLMPGKPVFVSTTPASPSYSRPITIKGTIQTSNDILPVASVGIYSDSSCQNILSSGTPSQFTSGTIALTADRNTTTTIYGATFNAVGTSSGCTFLKNFKHSDLGPLSTTATQNLDGTVSLGWSPDLTANPAPVYIVKRAMKSGGPYTVLTFSNIGSAFLDTSVTNGDQYYYVVAATNNTGTTLDSGEVSVTINAVSPDAGTSLVAAPGPGQVRLNWTGYGTDATFKVLRAAQSGGPYAVIATNLTVRTYTDSTVTNGTAYYYVVVGNNPSGDGSPSNEASAVPLDVPNTPTNLLMTPVLSSSDCGGAPGVQLVWTGPSYSTGFSINHGWNPTGLSAWASPSPATATRFTDCGPNSWTAGGANYYSVSALWSVGRSLASNVVGFSNIAAPLLTVAPGQDSVELSWTAKAGASGYDVYRSLTAGGPTTLISSLQPGTSYSDAAVSQGTTYYYHVMTHYPGPMISWPTIEQNGTPGPNPSGPTNLTVVMNNYRQPQLGWTSPSAYNDTYVYRAPSNTGPWTQIGTGTNSTFSDSNPLTGLNYYKVTAVWGSYETSSSNIVVIRSGYPATISATPSATDIALAWTAVPTATSYDVYRSTSYGSGYSVISSPTTNSFTDSTAAGGAGYHYYIIAKFADGTSGQPSDIASAMRTGTAVPSGLSVTSTTASSVSLVWAKVNSTATYKIYRATSSGGPYSAVQSQAVSGNIFTAASLSSGSTYYFKVTSVISGVESNINLSSYVSAVTYNLPQAPTPTAGDASISLTWLNPTGFTSVTLKRSTDGVSFSPVPGAIATTSNAFVDSTVSNGVAYYYLIEATFPTDVYASPMSNPVTPGIVPNVPAGLTVTDNSTGTDLTVTWGTVTGATGYRLYVAQASGGPYIQTLPKSSSANNTVSSLTAGTVYYLSVSALIGTVESAKSIELTVVPKAQPPAPTVATVNVTQVSISWPAVSGAATYDLQRSNDNVSFTTLAPGLATTSYVDTTVISGLSYFYRYLPKTAAGISMAMSAVGAQASVGQPPPIPVHLVGSTNTSGTQVDLAWVPSPNAAKYKVYRGLTAGGISLYASISATQTTYTDSAVNPATTYYYAVTAVDSYSTESSASNTVAVTTASGPTGLATSSVNGSINLSWNALGSAVSYVVGRGLTASGPFGAVAAGLTSTTFSDTNVQNGVTYYYVVRGVDVSGAYSPLSSPANAVGIARMNIEVPIELADQGLFSDVHPIVFERTRTSMNTAYYDGTVTYTFEINSWNIGATNAAVNLLNDNDQIVATINLPSGTTSTTRFTTTFSPLNASDTYRVQLPATAATADLRLLSARILVRQVGASKTRIYIPMLSSDQIPTQDDSAAIVEAKSSASYVTLGASSLFRRDTTLYSQLSDTNPWELETLVTSTGGAFGYLALYNVTQDKVVSTTETLIYGSGVGFSRSPFSEGMTYFDSLNEGDTYQLALKCSANCASGSVGVYKAGLWVTVTSLSKARVFYRLSQGFLNGGAQISETERTEFDAAAFSNPTAHWQATAVSDSSANGALALMTHASSDSGTSGFVAVSGSDLTFSSPQISTQESGTLTLTTGSRFLPASLDSTGIRVINSMLIIDATR